VPDFSRSQLVVYGAVAVALLLVGVRALQADSGPATAETTGGGAEASPTAALSVAGGGGDIVVDVSGAVLRPGVYRMPAGARVIDAMKRAGGATPGALVEAINRAARLTDGQQVVVPALAAAGAAGATVAATGGGGPISLGSATVEQLDTIDGIGPVTAQKIVEYRDQHGGLSSVEQLDEVSGIGPATMESLRSRLQS
jgi:competence protein ComEA